MAKALVVYATRTNQTASIANLVAEGIRLAGADATVVNITDFDKKGIDAQEFDIIAIGAPTYHGEMIQTMKTFLFGLEKLNLEGKVGGSFGAFGWSGEAPGRIYDTMKNVYKMEMATGPLRLKSASLGGGIQMAQDYGRELLQKVQR